MVAFSPRNSLTAKTHRQEVDIASTGVRNRLSCRAPPELTGFHECTFEIVHNEACIPAKTALRYMKAQPAS